MPSLGQGIFKKAFEWLVAGCHAKVGLWRKREVQATEQAIELLQLAQV
jgi:hypothetical protein